MSMAAAWFMSPPTSRKVASMEATSTSSRTCASARALVRNTEGVVDMWKPPAGVPTHVFGAKH